MSGLAIAPGPTSAAPKAAFAYRQVAILDREDIIAILGGVTSSVSVRDSQLLAHPEGRSQPHRRTRQVLPATTLEPSFETCNHTP